MTLSVEIGSRVTIALIRAMALTVLTAQLFVGCSSTPEERESQERMEINDFTKREAGSLKIVCLRTGLTLKPEWQEIKVAMKHTAGEAAIRHHNGEIERTTTWQGPRLADILAEGGAKVLPGEVLVVIARDGYRQVLTKAQLDGKVSTFDSFTGRPIDVGVTLEPILAIYRTGAPLLRKDRRLVWIGSRTDIAVDGTIMVRDLAELAIVPADQAESYGKSG